MTRQINQAGLDLIKSFESFSSTPYLDEGKGGVWTIGYGHTHGVTASYPPITESQGKMLLDGDLQAAEGYVERFITAQLTDNQFAALVSLTFNAGTAPLLEPLVGGNLDGRRYEQAADGFLAWNHVHIDGVLTVSAGLTRRRVAEKALFLTPDAKS